MKEMMKNTGILLAITVVAGLLLGLVYQITKDPIAAQEAKGADMSFEINISNGYVAGGTWIDASHAMQRLVTADTVISSVGNKRFIVPKIAGRDGYVRDIAVIAIPYRNDGLMRHITA